MNWWVWITGGLGLLILELFTPMGFYLFIIGLACLIVGVLSSIGLVTDLEPQLITASVLAIIAAFSIRRPLAAAMSALGKSTGSDITAQRVQISEDIAPGATGKGELGGTSWTVRNESKVQLVQGNTYPVQRTDSLTLVVTDL